MGDAAFARPTFTVREYYAFEEASLDRHEFFRGEIHAMAGGSPAHARLIGQATTEINLHLRGSGCYAAPSDQRIRAEEADLVAYPDVVVVCPQQAEFDSQNAATLLTPIYLVEILSASTENYDRTTKLEAYKRISKLAGVLIISQEIVRIEHHFRGDGGNWGCQTHFRRSDRVHLIQLGIEISVDEIYRDLDLPETTLELIP
jgi:Uma2 family endonuclease